MREFEELFEMSEEQLECEGWRQVETERENLEISSLCVVFWLTEEKVFLSLKLILPLRQ